MRQSISTEDLERVLGRIACCTAMLSVLVDSERAGTDGVVYSALCGVNELLELARESLESIIDAAVVHGEKGVQYAP